MQPSPTPGSLAMTEPIKIENRDGGCTFQVWVRPRAAADAVAGVRDGALVLRLNAPPAEGQANRRAVDFLSKLLNVPKRDVELVSGHSSRQKRIFVYGVDAAEIESRLRAAMS